MSPRLIFVGLWLATAACRGDRETAQTAAPAPASAPASHHTAAQRPELAPEADGGIATTDQVFAAEPVDYGWKARTEPELRRRLTTLPPNEIECRQTQCRLMFAGDAARLDHVIDDLAPLTGFAHNVKLSALQTRSDGTVSLQVYVRFDRPSE